MEIDDDFEWKPSTIKERLAQTPVLRWYYSNIILPLTSNHPTQRRLTVLVTMAVKALIELHELSI